MRGSDDRSDRAADRDLEVDRADDHGRNHSGDHDDHTAAYHNHGGTASAGASGMASTGAQDHPRPKLTTLGRPTVEARAVVRPQLQWLRTDRLRRRLRWRLGQRSVLRARPCARHRHRHLQARRR